MKISLMQYPLAWADIRENLTVWEQRLAPLAGKTDVVVLPEMFTTGFCTDDMYLAEDMQGTTVQKLKEWSRNYGFALVGSFMAKEDARIYNRAFFVEPDGTFSYADKRHLFSMGGEHQYLSAGNRRLIVNYKGVKFCVLVCYDLRFPVWARNVDNAYDVLVYVANWPEQRIKDWDILLAARAVENQAYVCAVNRVGDDGRNLHYNGHSVLIDNRGNKVLGWDDNEEGVKTAEVDLERLHKGREKFPVWKDADVFQIIK